MLADPYGCPLAKAISNQESFALSRSPHNVDTNGAESRMVRQFGEAFQSSVRDALDQVEDPEKLLGELVMALEQMRAAPNVNRMLVDVAATVIRSLHEVKGLHPPDL